MKDTNDNTTSKTLLSNHTHNFQLTTTHNLQIFTLKQIFEKSWEYAKDLFACFVDLEKAYDRIPRDKLWRVLQEYGQLLQAIKSFYCQPEVCVRVNRMQSKPFRVGVGLRQGCVLSPLLFIIYMNWIDRCSQTSECDKSGVLKSVL